MISTPFWFPGNAHSVTFIKWFTDINHIKTQYSVWTSFMVASDLRTFVEYEIFHRKSDVVPNNLVTISVLVVHLKEKANVF